MFRNGHDVGNKNICSIMRSRDQKAPIVEPCVHLSASKLTEYRQRFQEHRMSPAVHSAKKYKDENHRLDKEKDKTVTFRSDTNHELVKNIQKELNPRMPLEDHIGYTGTFNQVYPLYPVKDIVTKKQSYHPSMTKMVSQSVYQEDYKAWKVFRLPAYSQSDNLKIHTGPFETTTTSQDAFSLKGPVEVRGILRPPLQSKETLPFDSTTNYRSQYVTYSLQPRRPLVRPSSYHPNSPSLVKVSTTHWDYRGLPAEPVRSFKPTETWAGKHYVFDGTTEFQDKFQTWPLEAKVRRVPEKFIPPGGNIESVSTTHAHYVPHKWKRPVSALLPVQALRRERPLVEVGRSTMKEDFRAWPMVRRTLLVQQPELELPKGAFATTTTARSAYSPKAVQRTVSYKPAQRPLSAKPMLEKDTIYRISYTARNTPPVQARNGLPLELMEYDRTAWPRLYKSVSVDHHM